jgi:hypothetical protein
MDTRIVPIPAPIRYATVQFCAQRYSAWRSADLSKEFWCHARGSVSLQVTGGSGGARPPAASQERERETTHSTRPLMAPAAFLGWWSRPRCLPAGRRDPSSLPAAPSLHAPVHVRPLASSHDQVTTNQTPFNAFVPDLSSYY